MCFSMCRTVTEKKDVVQKFFTVLYWSLDQLLESEVNSTNTGGPAFPAIIPLVHSERQGKDYPDYSESGMTLRDYFAAKAIEAVDWSNLGIIDGSKTCYEIADAMLKAREA